MRAQSEHQTPAVIFIHGWRGSTTHYLERAQELAAHDITSLVVSLSGHDENSRDINKVTRAQHLEEVIAAYDFLACKKYVEQEKEEKSPRAEIVPSEHLQGSKAHSSS